MRVVNINREYAAQDLVLPACPGIYEPLFVVKSIIDRLVEGGLEMEESYVLETAPVLGKDGLRGEKKKVPPT